MPQKVLTLFSLLAFGLFCLAVNALAQTGASNFNNLDLSQYKLPPNFDKMSQVEQALVILTQEAEKDNPQAMVELGVFYERGIGVRRDYTQALEWYKKAAAKEFPPAFYNVGMAYLIGQGDAPNVSQGLDNIRRAALRSYPMADFQLAVFYLRGQHVPKNVSEGLKYLNKAVEAGLLIAINELAVINYNGLWEQKVDKTKAFQLFTQAAESGYGESMRNLAVCYVNGDGQAKDPVQALKWFILARNIGFNPAEMDQMANSLKKSLTPSNIAQAEKDAKAWEDAAIAKIQAFQQANAGAQAAQSAPAAQRAKKADQPKPAAKPAAKPATRARSSSRR
ncbi:MAG: sel1 repeat family protein [Deltaproteobacteria bacterium]|jgi:TPR repeat protein|nr:sel1 repeat family protein [Deltaproteobacteria bacterium]